MIHELPYLIPGTPSAYHWDCFTSLVLFDMPTVLNCSKQLLCEGFNGKYDSNQLAAAL